MLKEIENTIKRIKEKNALEKKNLINLLESISITAKYDAEELMQDESTSYSEYCLTQKLSNLQRAVKIIDENNEIIWTLESIRNNKNA